MRLKKSRMKGNTYTTSSRARCSSKKETVLIFPSCKAMVFDNKKWRGKKSCLGKNVYLVVSDRNTTRFPPPDGTGWRQTPVSSWRAFPGRGERTGPVSICPVRPARPLHSRHGQSDGLFGIQRPIGHQVWLLTQFYSVDFSHSRIAVQKCVFNKGTIKVCVSCFWQCPGTSALCARYLTLSFFLSSSGRHMHQG